MIKGLEKCPSIIGVHAYLAMCRRVTITPQDLTEKSSVSESTVLTISNCCLFIINRCAIALLINAVESHSCWSLMFLLKSTQHISRV